MKQLDEMTPEELRWAAFEAIAASLGYRALARFVSENGLGSGDYTAERHKWFSDEGAIDAIKQDLRKGA